MKSIGRTALARRGPVALTVIVWIMSLRAALSEPQCGMYRYDPQRTGRSPYAATYAPTLDWVRATGINSSATPVISENGNVCYGAYDDCLYAITSEGSVAWKFKGSGMITGSAAVANDGTIYFGTASGKLYALNNTGTMKWTAPYSLPLPGVSGSVMIGKDGTIYFGADNCCIYALNPNGNLKWSYRTGGAVKLGLAESPDGTTVYASSNDGYIYALSSAGALKWKSGYLSPSSLTAVGDDGAIYFGTNSGRLYALNPNGTTRWSFQAAAKVSTAPAIAKNGDIFFGSLDRGLYCLNSNGVLQWKYASPNSLYSAPIIDPMGKLLFGEVNNQLTALDCETGRVDWVKHVDGSLYTSPAIAADGSIYVLTSSGLLTKFVGPVAHIAPEPSSILALTAGLSAVLIPFRRRLTTTS